MTIGSSAFIGLGFLNPWLLWAAPLAAVPIVIHLLNRRRFKKIRWAAMEYLLNALKRNRRRLRMEHWLLLALRTLAVLLLIFLVTRPQLSGSVLGETRTHHVICLDDSASMAHRSGATNTYKDALDHVLRLAEKLGESRSGDLLTILRASQHDTPVVMRTRVGGQLKALVRENISDLGVGDGRMDVAQLLKAARERASETEGATRTEIYLITDFRKVDWLTDEGKPKPQIINEVMELNPQDQHFTVVSVGPADSQNLAVTGIRHMGRVAVAGVPVAIAIELKNQGLSASAPLELAITVDGKSQITRAVDPLEPGQTQVVPVSHTFHEPGYHGVSAELPTDRYPTDDGRALALRIAEYSRVLLVDGDPGERPDEAETFYLAAALEPGGDARSGISVQVIPDHVLPEQDLSDVDSVWLCNLPVPSKETVEKLEQFAAGGGGVIFYLGNQVDAVRYNDAFFKEGRGLLPVALQDMRGDVDKPETVFLADGDHGSMSVVTEDLAKMFARVVPVMRYFGLDEASAPTAKVILRAGGNTGSPLMVSRHFDQGEVVLFALTADVQWTLWQATPAFQIVNVELHRTTAKKHDFADYNLGPAGQLALSLHAGRYRRDVVVRGMRDDAGERTFTATTGESEELANVEIPMSALRGFGLFKVMLTPHAGNPEERMLARNSPIEEGRLQKLGKAGFASTYPDTLADRVTFVEDDAAAGTGVLRAGQGEIWRILALGLLGALLLESLLAWRFGRRGR